MTAVLSMHKGLLLHTSIRPCLSQSSAAVPAAKRWFPSSPQVIVLLQAIPNAVYVGEVIAGGYTSVREVMVHFFW